MSIVRRNAWDFDKYFNGPNLFDDFFKVALPETKTLSTQNKHSEPQVDISETETQYVVSLAAPGLAKKDLNVEVLDDGLSVSYEKKEEDNSIFIKKSFSRKWQLPEGVDPDSVSAEFKNGILTVAVNKPAIAEPSHRIIKIK